QRTQSGFVRRFARSVRIGGSRGRNPTIAKPRTMAIAVRRFLRGVVFVAIFFASIAPAVAAVDRPNELDRRVDAISAHALLTQPAIGLVDPTRQEAAVRLVHMILPGWLAMAIFEAVALAYFWSTGRAAAVRDRLRRHIGSEWGVRFAFGATLGL